MLTTGTILNPALMAALTGVGHGQLVVIADAGLPLPHGSHVVDLSLRLGIPSFEQVVSTVLAEAAFDGYIVASEAESAAALAGVQSKLSGLERTVVPHEEFKLLLPGAHLIVRTGECTPYANIALVATTTFSTTLPIK